MPRHLPSPPPLTAEFGYTCKIWLAYMMEKHHLGGVYYCWFAKELNPIRNGESSNPLQIFDTLDTAVQKRDVNHPKVKDLKSALLRVITRLIAPHDPPLAKLLRREITRAPLEAFHPQLWRIDMNKIAPERIRFDRSQPAWDEQYISDLSDGEFEIIVP